MACCVPNCGSKRSKSTFGVPKDPELYKAWVKALGISLKPSSRVCENHFEPKDVHKEWVSGQGLSKITISLKKPKLISGTVPKKELLQSSPQITLPIEIESDGRYHINGKILIESTNAISSNSCDIPFIKKQKTDSYFHFQHDHCYFKEKFPTEFSPTIDSCNNSFNESTNLNNDSDILITEPTRVFESVVRMIHQIHVPLHWFSEVIPRDGDINEKVVYFHKLSPFKENCIRTIEKYVILFRDSSIVINVHGKNIKTEDIGLSSKYLLNCFEDLENILKTLDKVNFCSGSRSFSDNKSIKTKYGIQNLESSNQWRHSKCKIILKNNLSNICIWCKRLNELTLQCVENIKQQKTSKLNCSLKTQKKLEEIKKQKLVVSRRLSRSLKKIDMLHNTINLMRSKMEEISNTSLQRVLENSNIPKCQMDLINEIYNASKVNNPRNRKYSDNWLLFCLMFRIKSLSGYNFLRDKNMLPLPCINTVSKILKQKILKKDFQKKVIQFNDENSLCQNTDTLLCSNLKDFDKHIQIKNENDSMISHNLKLMFQSVVEKIESDQDCC